jgi:hypothetical protein
MENKNKFKKACAFALAMVLIVGAAYTTLEPTLTKASATASDPINVNLSVDPTLSITSPADVSMSPNITGTGASTGSAVWSVTTNSVTGWKLEVAASAAPAMTSGANNFADYTEGVLGTPEIWSVAAAASEFGFTATGSFAEAKYTASKYQGFQGTTKIQVSHSTTGPDAGDATTVGFKAEVGASKSQATGNYQAIITATATSLP